jgi:hypothetical protein
MIDVPPSLPGDTGAALGDTDRLALGDRPATNDRRIHKA